MAEASLYPNGPNTDLGNEAPEKILGTFSGNHTGALMWGERKHREAFTKMYGYDTTLKMMENMLQKNKPKENDKRGKEWFDDAKAYYDEILALQGS